jgi:hypothetical protein
VGQARKTTDIPEVVDARARQQQSHTQRQARKTALEALQGKTFSSMSRADKDVLLQELCERLGLLQDGKGA